MVNFRSEQHQLFTMKQTKKSLSPFDDKQYILEDGYTTRAHGHYQNGITRPSKAAESSGKELTNSMNVLSLTNTDGHSDTIMESNENHIDLPLTPPTSNKFHSYLASFWR